MSIPVQLYFPQQRHRANGSASCLAERFVVVNLSPKPSRTDIFERGNPVRAVVMQGGTILTGDTVVQMETGGSVMLGFSKPLRKLQSREALRVPVSAAVEFRFLFEGMPLTPWQTAELRDVSVGGLCFEFESFTSTEHPVELCVHLPERTAAASDGAEPAPGERGFKVHATGRIAWTRPSAGKRTLVGIQFTRVLTRERLRLADFIAEQLPSE